MTEPTRSLHRKLAQIMYEAERIPKNGRAPEAMGGYPFVQVGDAADFIRKALAEKVLTMMPTGVRVTGQADRPTKTGGSMTTVDLITTWTITDGESGESITIESFGAGADGGDKYSGKASTSAMKYALLTGFLLSTGEDSELGGHEAAGPRAERPRPAAGQTAPTSDGGLIGVVDVKPEWLTDLELRQTPEGPVIGFRLKQGRQTLKVRAHGKLAEQLAAVPGLAGVMVTCWGTLVGDEFTPKGTTKPVPYQTLVLARLHAPTFDLPPISPLLSPTAPDAPSAGLTEAPSEPLFGDAAQAEVDAELDRILA